jgi:hypothetical protein
MALVFRGGGFQAIKKAISNALNLYFGDRRNEEIQKGITPLSIFCFRSYPYHSSDSYCFHGSNSEGTDIATKPLIRLV